MDAPAWPTSSRWLAAIAMSGVTVRCCVVIGVTAEEFQASTTKVVAA